MHAAALFPLAWLIFDYWFGFLGVEPVRAIILRTGKAAIILLVASLACTPLNTVLGWKYALTMRKPLGLYAFMYVCLHLLTFVWLDYAFVFPLIVEEIVKRRYALVGFAAFLLLVPLALTSNRYSMKKLGKNWKKLHTLVYLIGILAVIHYVWLVKNAYTQPLIFATVLATLLIIRLPAIKQFFLRTQRQVKARIATARKPTA
ncbi:MAG: protein-methionine-sulfoxide reductase heme-binding subunit MsrQ [Chloroflexota bacterium]